MRGYFVFVLVFFVFCFGVDAATLKQLSGAGKAPIHIKARKLEVFDKKGFYRLTGDVVVIKDGMKLTADRVDVYRDKKTGEVIKIVCIGNVVMKKANRTARAKKAIYESKQDRILLIGDAVVSGDGNVIKSDRIVYYLDRDYAVATSTRSGGVKITINPKSNSVVPAIGKKKGTEKGKER